MELEGLKKIAEGGQAVIYALDNDKVLRVMRRAEDKELLLTEMQRMQALFNMGVSVPEIYGYDEADGKPVLIMQRINGPSMLDMIQKNPFGIRKYAKELAEIQTDLAKHDAPEGMVSSVDRAFYILEKNTLLSAEQKDFIRGLISGLPKGKSLLHGDFQPGNILFSGGKTYLIDWARGSKGEMISDAAHSYLILKNVPRIPGISGFMFALMRFLGGVLAKSYLKEVKLRIKFDEALFSKWICVIAAERSFYGHPSEKEKLLEFIESCRLDKDRPEGWYRKI